MDHHPFYVINSTVCISVSHERQHNSSTLWAKVCSTILKIAGLRNTEKKRCAWALAIQKSSWLTFHLRDTPLLDLLLSTCFNPKSLLQWRVSSQSALEKTVLPMGGHWGAKEKLFLCPKLSELLLFSYTFNIYNRPKSKIYFKVDTILLLTELCR